MTNDVSNNLSNNLSSEQPIVNRVAQSAALRLVDLEQYYPTVPLAGFDLQSHLFGGMILKEKDFREALKTIDWTLYDGKAVFIHCSADTIVPVWAYMLVAGYVKDHAVYAILGTEENLVERLMLDAVNTIDTESFRGKKVLVKGCSDKPVPFTLYVELARMLLPVVNSLMYGEACSNVPVFKSGKMS